MNFFKRAFFSLWYRKRNFFLLSVVFFVLSLLILTGFSIHAGCNQTAKEMRQSIGASVTIYDFHAESSDVFYGANLLDPGSMEMIASHPLVEGANPFIYSMAVGTEDISPIVSEAQDKRYTQRQNSWLRVEGTFELRFVSEFASGNSILAEGRFFRQEDQMAAVISSDIALAHGIRIGDTIRLDAFYTEMEQGPGYHGSNVQVKVLGIYSVQNYLARTDMPLYNTENVVYLTPDAAYSLNGTGNAYSVKFNIADPERAEEFIKDVQAMRLEGEDHFQFVVDTTQYRSMQGAVASLTRLAAVMSIAAILMGGIVQVMMLMITLKDRDFEVGVLLAMGERKGKILAQLQLESLIPVLVSITASLACSELGRQMANVLFTTSIQAVVTPGVICAMYMVGILLTLLASSVIAWEILRYQPKKVLMSVE